LHNFGCHGNFLGSVENSGSIFEFNNPVLTCFKFLDFSQGIEICAILAYFCPNLVVMATPSTSLEILVAHFNESPQNPTEHAKNSSIFCKEQKFVQFWLIFF